MGRSYYHDGVAKTFSDSKLRALYNEYWAIGLMDKQSRWICETRQDAKYMANLRKEMKLRKSLVAAKNKLLAQGVGDVGRIEELECMLRHGLLKNLCVQEAIDMVGGDSIQENFLRRVVTSTPFNQLSISCISSTWVIHLWKVTLNRKKKTCCAICFKYNILFPSNIQIDVF